MTLLKADAAHDVRSLPTALAAPTERPLVERPDPRIAMLTAEREAALAALETARDEAERAVEKAYADGLAAAERHEDRRIAAVEAGVGEALVAWRAGLDGLEALAVLLAEAALGKMFDDPRDLADLVARTLARRIAAIDAAAIVRVAVSARDFADDAALAALAERSGLAVGAITAEETVAGACRIDLAIGHLDLGIERQWRTIADGLLAIAADQPA